MNQIYCSLLDLWLILIVVANGLIKMKGGNTNCKFKYFHQRIWHGFVVYNNTFVYILIVFLSLQVQVVLYRYLSILLKMFVFYQIITNIIICIDMLYHFIILAIAQQLTTVDFWMTKRNRITVNVASTESRFTSSLWFWTRLTEIIFYMHKFTVSGLLFMFLILQNKRKLVFAIPRVLTNVHALYTQLQEKWTKCVLLVVIYSLHKL